MKKFFPLGLLLLLLPLACTEEESSIGINLEDPMTMYNGQYCSVNFTASTCYDDSLLTVGYTAGLFGNYTDATFGKVNATIFSQIALATSTGISFADSVIVDSVIMTLIIDTALFANDAETHDLHVQIRQLAQPVCSDSVYYAFSSIPNGPTTFFDDHVTFSGDSLHMRMRNDIIPILKQQSCSSEEFLSIAKGFSLRLAEDSPEGLLTVDFSATNTRLVMHYHHPSDPYSALAYTFVINSEATHFMNYTHDYHGTVIDSLVTGKIPKLDGSQRLYLEPLGGTKIQIDIQPFLDTFCTKHPTAVIHYAQLILPTEDSLAVNVPNRILAYGRANASSSYSLITDANVLSNPYTYSGFDGYYNSQSHQYRMRFTRHLQEMMRSRKDYGTILHIDARRSTGFRTVLAGPQATKSAKLEFIYTE